MVRSKGKSFLSKTEEDVLKDRQKELQDNLKEKRISGIGTAAEQIDEGKIKSEIKHISKVLEDGKVPIFKGSEKDKAVAELRILEEKLSEGLPTKEEMNHPAKNPGAVRKHMGWLNRNNANIERYRTLQRILNPEDPRSIENLRKEK